MPKKKSNAKKWHHDIKYIELPCVDGSGARKPGPPWRRWVEDVVVEYQKTKDEYLLQKVMDNYMIFQFRWAKDFAPYLDGGLDEGKEVFIEVIWRSAAMFDLNKQKKPKGKSFNAYLTSALMNKKRTLKAQRFKGPPINCQVCGERLSYIDEKHLKHEMTIKKYVERYPNYPLVSYDGKTRCPFTGERVHVVTIERVNRVAGYYTVDDWLREFGGLFPNRACPLTGLKITDEFPEILAPKYTASDLQKDFPAFKALIRCPASGKQIFYVTQKHLDDHVNMEGRKRISMAEFARLHPRATLATKQAPVLNPYTGQTVQEIGFDDLAKEGITVKDHVTRFHTIVINKLYPKAFPCPFTGKMVDSITTSYLDDLGVSPMSFYLATCEYPLRKFRVKCALCGKWVNNIWGHVADAKHNYAEVLTPSEYEQKHGPRSRSFMVVRTEIDNEDGENTKLTDLVAAKESFPEILLDLEYAFAKVAMTDLDRKIADVIKSCKTVEDIVDKAVERKTIQLSRPFSMDEEPAIKEMLSGSIGTSDFEIERSSEASLMAKVIIPSKRTVYGRIKELRTLVDGV